MTDLIFENHSRRDGVTIPTIWLAIVLSLLLHVAVMWHWLPRLDMLKLAQPEHDTLIVRLSPPAGPPATAPSIPSRPSRTTPAAPPARTATTQPAPASPPASASQGMAPSATAPPSAPRVDVAPSLIRIPSAGDLASYIEARRLARGDPAPPSQSAANEKSRTNQIASANLAQQQLAFGYDPSRSGGIFEVRRMGYSEAELMFFGWNKEVRHRTAQLIEVKKGDVSDIRLAIVRRMIVIVRQFEQADFEWTSQRLGRDVTLSARARDTAGLEDFLMQEFFHDQRPSR